jgi:hypothetical protein
MLFANLRSNQKQLSKVIARDILAGTKRRFILRASWVAGIVYWLGMNALFLTRYHESLTGRFLAVWEVAIFVIGVFFGYLSSLIMWKRFKKLAESE